MKDKSKATPPKKYSTRYPWGRWFKKSKFSLTQGSDYHCAQHGMAQMVRNRGRQCGFSVSLKLGGGGLIEVRLTPLAGTA